MIELDDPPYVLGIVTRSSGTPFEHAYGILYTQKAWRERSTEHRLISYSGLASPPTAALTNFPSDADAAIFLPVTAKAARRLVEEIQTIAGELQQSPPKRRYFFSDYVSTSPAEPQDRQRTRLNKIHAVMAGKHSRPTNCVHFLLQACMRAGIDIPALGDNLPKADMTQHVVETVERALSKGSQALSSCAVSNGEMTWHAARIGESQALFVRNTETIKLPEMICALPSNTLAIVADAQPLQARNLARYSDSIVGR